MWPFNVGRVPASSIRSPAGLCAVVGLCVAMGACTEENAAPVGSPPLLETGADMVLTDLEHSVTLDGVKDGDLYADTAFWYRDSTEYHLVNPRLVLYVSGSGAQRARVTAERGVYDPGTREMLASGNVVLIITEGNKRVESQQLNYDPRGDRIWSDSLTTMIEPGRVSEGLGFESDLDFRRTTVGPGSIRSTGGGDGAEEEGGEEETEPDTVTGSASVADTAGTSTSAPDTSGPGQTRLEGNRGSMGLPAPPRTTPSGP